jgi:hypothetical protein
MRGDDARVALHIGASGPVDLTFHGLDHTSAVPLLIEVERSLEHFDEKQAVALRTVGGSCERCGRRIGEVAAASPMAGTSAASTSDCYSPTFSNPP